MGLTKNGVMTFRMSKIHISTYSRIRKVLVEEEGVGVGLIE